MSEAPKRTVKGERENIDAAFWTVPNILCLARYAGSFSLVPIALAGHSYWFVGVYLILISSDLIDGPIARKLHQRSDLGAHLDSIADLTLNACLLAGVMILCWDSLRSESAWLLAVIISYLSSIALGFRRYGRLLSYHTYIAKGTQWLAVFAAISLVLDWSIWPFRLAAIAAIIGNLETITITALSPNWRSDVPSLFSVWPRR